MGLLLIGATVAVAGVYDETVRPVLTQYCAGCHAGESPAGGLAIATLLEQPEDVALADRAHWEAIARRMRAGEMPPPGLPQPERANTVAVADWVEASYARLDRSQPVDPGRVTARRLNRVEYANSVRDLLGLDMNPAAELPPDPYGYGFDNIGDVLSTNSALLDQYVKAAETIARASIPMDGETIEPTMQRYLAERIGQDRQMRMRVDHAFPADGVYTLRTAFYQALKDGTRVRLTLSVDGREVGADELKFYYQIDRAIEAVAVPLTAGVHRIDATIEVLPEPEYKGKPPYLEYVQVYGPMKVLPAAESQAYRRFFTCGHAPGKHEPEACSKVILQPLARRAFRRPLRNGELERLLRLAAMERERTGSFEQSMRTALEAVLASPHFLFRIEADGAGPKPHPLSDHELATRMSYFLWSSLPDDELEQLADAGELRQNLPGQLERMLQTLAW
ncbi:MAG: DUF1587 domain-containing protein [Bryobacterales bacterium]